MLLLQKFSYLPLILCSRVNILRVKKNDRLTLTKQDFYYTTYLISILFDSGDDSHVLYENLNEIIVLYFDSFNINFSTTLFMRSIENCNSFP